MGENRLLTGIQEVVVVKLGNFLDIVHYFLVKLISIKQMTIFEEVKKLDLPIGQYAVVGSGVMSAHGIRQHNDVDLIVTQEFFDHLKSTGWQVVPDRLSVIKNGNYEADVNFRYGEYNPDHNALIKDAEIINGVPFIRLEELIKFKKALGRDKDKKDVELIEEYLIKHKN